MVRPAIYIPPNGDEKGLTYTMTKREMLNQVIAIVEESTVDNKSELVEKLNHEIELLNKKSSSSRKPTKTQIENEEFKSQILEFLAKENKMVRIKEIQDGIPALSEISNQRISHLMRALVNAGSVERTLEKRVAYFSLV